MLTKIMFVAGSLILFGCGAKNTGSQAASDEKQVSTQASASKWKLISTKPERDAGAYLSEGGISCRLTTDAFNPSKKVTIVNLIDHRFDSVHNVLMRGHRVTVTHVGHDKVLCKKIEALKVKGKMTEFKINNKIYMKGTDLKEVVNFKFANGVMLQTEKIFNLK